MEINEKEFTAELARVFKLNGLGAYLNTEKSAKFLALTKRMLEENEKYNLTAITDIEKIILNHYADCAALADRLPKKAKIIDVGCGAGFPTLPLAIVRDDIEIFAIDSTAKRIAYVEESARLLSLGNVKCAVMRAEDGAKMPEYREKFDIATARAVAPLPILLEYTAQIVKVGGIVLAYKTDLTEVDEGKNAAKVLGLKLEKHFAFTLPNGSNRCLLVYRKIAHTPRIYPRGQNKPRKMPL